MYKFIYFILSIIALATDPLMGVVMIIGFYFWVGIESWIKDQKTETYRERFEKISKQKSYIVEDYETDTATKKIL